LTRPPDVDALLSEQARRFGDRVYLECVDPPGQRLTFAQLDAGCHRVAHLLARRGVRANERVTLLGDNGPAFILLFFGILRYGATVNPLNAEVLGPDLPRILHDVAPRLITLTGRVVLNKEKNVMRGTMLTVNLVTGKAELGAKGASGGRVQGLFTPPPQQQGAQNPNP